MSCKQVRSLFPAYLDEVATGSEMHMVSGHLNQCMECRSEYRKLENTRRLVSSLGRKPVPNDLALKIRLAVSRERSHTWRSIAQAYLVRLEDALNAFMFPATAGVLTAIIFFGAFTGFFVAAPAGGQDFVPGIYLPAHLKPPQTAMSSVADTDLNLEAPVTVQAFIDAGGRVQKYEIVSGPDNEKVRSQLNRALLFATFTPAYAFGRPVAGTAVIRFSHVNVKG
jgi:Putative zinc-finger